MSEHVCRHSEHVCKHPNFKLWHHCCACAETGPPLSQQEVSPQPDKVLRDKILELRNASISYGKMGSYYVRREDIDNLCDEILTLAKV